MKNLSFAVIPQFLFLLGLNFINGLPATAATQPLMRFGAKVDAIADGEFYDVLKTEAGLWIASDSLIYKAEGGSTKVVREARTSSLVYDSSNSRVWFAGAGVLGFVDSDGNPQSVAEIGGGFIWELIHKNDRIWYFGSSGYGWVSTYDFSDQYYNAFQFEPRPVVSDPGFGFPFLLVGTSEGIYSVGTDSMQLLYPAADTGGNMVVWAVGDGNRILLGTRREVLRWDGSPGSQLNTLSGPDYPEQFELGINNAIRKGDSIFITAYPWGVAEWSRRKQSIVSRLSEPSGLSNGDVFKIRPDNDGNILIVGTRGIVEFAVADSARFVPSADDLNPADYRAGTISGGVYHLIYGDQVVDIDQDHVRTRQLIGTPNWIDAASDGSLMLGYVDSFLRLESDAPGATVTQLSSPISRAIQGAAGKFGVGYEGVYAISENYELDRIYASKHSLSLLGERDGVLYILEEGERIVRLERQSDQWTATPLPGQLRGQLKTSLAGDAGIYLATSQQFYLLKDDQLQVLPMEFGWEIKGLGGQGASIYAAMWSELEQRWAVAGYAGGSSRMLAVPHLEKIGLPLDVLSDGASLALVGTEGIGLFQIEDLPKVDQPGVTFDLLFEDRRVEGERIPPGLHFIDLKVGFTGPDLPVLVQYRINDQRWRTVNLQDPSLQFAGHGKFTVELRAMHPNGNVSPVRMVQFGIAPPWYLNPLFQVFMAVFTVLLIWALFYLRSRQLKRTNAWLQREVTKRTRELEAATAAQTNFLAGLSHDIRNPLNGVLMIAETLSRDPPTSGEDQRLKDLTEFGVIVDRMLGEILDFSAIDQSKSPTSFISVSITDIIESTVKQNQFGIQREMVAVSTQIDSSIRDLIISTDRNWMIKILSNLLINALEYSGSERIEIGANCRRRTDREAEIDIWVADWGCGIDDSEKAFVFERFYRGESGIESGRHGTGLGLSICQEIAHSMGAHLLLENNQPSGCRFILKGRFDIVEGARELDKEAVLATLSGKHVLVVDDLKYNRTSVVDFLRTLKCTCDEAESGTEALELLRRNSYHLALIDWDLPGLNGPDVARRYRKDAPDDPVMLVAVTAYTDAAKKLESEEAGMNGYISKPLTAARLAHVLSNIKKWRPSKELGPDVVAFDEVQDEIYKHIDECLFYGEQLAYENLRRCAHRLTTLAMIRNNSGMQSVCRDLQIAAQEQDAESVRVGLAELLKWRKP